MSNIIDMDTLREEFKSKIKAKDLSAFAQAQQSIIEKLIKEGHILKQKNAQLELMLQSLSKNDIVTEVSPEEMICIEQVSLLKTKSAQRELSLEEAKKLDLFVKNLKLIREEATIVVNNLDTSNTKEADLVAIARGTQEQSE